MTTQTFALIVAAVSCAIAAGAVVLALLAFRRAPLAGNGPIDLADVVPAGTTFHDAALLTAMGGMLSHGDTQDRSAFYIANKAQQIADYMVRVRRAA